jgi:type 1 glutamine amidotransferase
MSAFPDAGADATLSVNPPDAAATATGDSSVPQKILIYTKCTGFVHASIPAAANAIANAAMGLGIASDQSADPAKFAPDQLAQYGAVVLVATTGEPLGSPGTQQIDALVAFVRGGRGLVAIEDANHAYDTNTTYVSLIGGDFNGHLGFGNYSCTKLGDHPSVHLLPATFPITDEVYNLPNQFRMDNQVVLRCGPNASPISWVRAEGAGRVFYTALGHADASWTMPPLVDSHVIPGLLWTMGR